MYENGVITSVEIVLRKEMEMREKDRRGESN
jgi:hypothetical protein